MHILNKVFDKIYCVTVHDFYDRHDLVRKQLQGIDFQWMLSPPAGYLKEGVLPASNISLILGHMSCIWDAKINRYNKIAIWEDDGVLTATEEDMQLFFSNIPASWDCLYMATASWSTKLWTVGTEPVSPYVNKVLWGTGSGFTGIQSHIFDAVLDVVLQLKDPVDFSYYTIFKRGNSYAPAKGYFSDPISMPNELYLDKVTSTDGFLPSRVMHDR